MKATYRKLKQGRWFCYDAYLRTRSLLTEKQLNTEIAKLLKPESLTFDNDGFPIVKSPNIEAYFDLNYCSDWDRLMPMSTKLNISLLDEYFTGLAGKSVAEISKPALKLYVVNGCPKRAIAECVLLSLIETNPT